MLKVFVTNGRADQHGIPSFINVSELGEYSNRDLKICDN